MKTNKILLTGLVLTALAGTVMASTNNQVYTVGQYRNNVEANNSILYGEDNNVTQHNDGNVVKNILVGGYNNLVQHDAHNSITVGNSNNNNSANSVVSGFHNTITNADNSIAGGTQNASHSANTLVFGNTNAIDFESDNSFAGGENVKLKGKNSFVFGEGAVVNADNAYAIGKEATANAENTIAIGNQAKTTYENTVAIGNNVTTGKKGSIGIGSDITNTNGYGIVIGNSSSTNSLGGVVIGDFSKSTSDNGVAIGNSNEAASNSTAVGSIASATGVTSVAIGSMVTAEGTSSVNIGHFNMGASNYSTLIGDANIIQHSDHLEDPEGDVAIGSSNVAQDSYNVIMMGKDNEVTNADYAVAIGNSASVTKNESIALGHNANANTVIGTASIDINGETHTFAGTTPVGTVSIGDSGKERTITNVAAGRISDTSTDAINGSQLNAVVEETNKIGTKVNNHEERITANENHIGDLENKITNVGHDTLNQANSYTDSQVAKVGASAAALSALHPLDYNPDHKTDIMAGVGHYKGKTAVALGVAYRPNENVLLSLGTTVNGKDTMVNAGVSYKVGAKDSTYRSPASMAKDIDDLKAIVNKLVEENKQLREQVNSK